MSEAEEIAAKVAAANRNGYGKVISSSIRYVNVKNETGNKFKLRCRENDTNDWRSDDDLSPGMTRYYPTAYFSEISLNSGKDADDIKIHDGLGFIEFICNESDYSAATRGPILVSWRPSTKAWRLHPVYDSVDGHDTLLVPYVNGDELTITLLDKQDYKRNIEYDFFDLRIGNKTLFDFPIKFKRKGKWSDAATIKPDCYQNFSLKDLEAISLNGGDDSDDIQIHNDKGYIEFLDNDDKYTLVWWNPTAQKWCGSATKSSINGHNDVFLDAAVFDVTTISFILSQGRSTVRKGYEFKVY